MFEISVYKSVETVWTGFGSLEKISEEAKRLGASKVLIVTDKGIVEAGHPDTAKEHLERAGVKFDVFDEVKSDPAFEDVEPGIEMAKRNGYDVIIGLGGGSSMDTAKGISIMAINSGSLKDYAGVGNVPKAGLPTIMIPTTSGTGSEITPNAIFTDVQRVLKVGLVSDFIRPNVAIIDPELSITLPPDITVATGMDALTHAIESYTSVNATLRTEIYALEAIKLIARSLRHAVANGKNREARYDMSMGSYIAALSFSNAGTGAVHALAYPLGAKYHLSHGITNTLMLPYVMKFNMIGNIPKFAAIARAMGEPVDGMSDREAAALAVKAVSDLADDIGAPRKLADVGVPESDIEDLASRAIQIKRLLANNPREVTEKDIVEIYRMAV